MTAIMSSCATQQRLRPDEIKGPSAAWVGPSLLEVKGPCTTEDGFGGEDFDKHHFAKQTGLMRAWREAEFAWLKESPEGAKCCEDKGYARFIAGYSDQPPSTNAYWVSFEACSVPGSVRAVYRVDLRKAAIACVRRDPPNLKSSWPGCGIRQVSR